MTDDIRRLSKEQAQGVARLLALQYAARQEALGELIGVEPDDFRPQKVGKTPIYWVATFEVRHGDNVLDGPAAYVVNIEAGSVEPGI